ncbi:hypothetical protein GL263_26150 [Streptomyces durbertensis]|uniref:Uncharacterized protein n=1 Tax=Streptomyces durbertensis TaxID=2448886 RepID=A0ABR6ENT4_9ACTN|nr:hypothetical protein [Streptomyces durbertensis]MBB1247001.1 hypothetical protein [Streptomyces durbertensis]
MAAEKRGLSGVSRLGRWTASESDRYVDARELVNQVIGVYSGLIHRATSEEEAEALVSAQADQSLVLQRMTLGDPATIERILNEYPDLVRRLRAASR